MKPSAKPGARIVAVTIRRADGVSVQRYVSGETGSFLYFNFTARQREAQRFASRDRSGAFELAGRVRGLRGGDFADVRVLRLVPRRRQP